MEESYANCDEGEGGTAMPKAVDIGKEFVKTAERAAERAAREIIEEKIQDEHQTNNEEFDSPISHLLSNIPSGDRYYLKLYRELPNGKWEFKRDIEDYAHWTDVEAEVANIVRTAAQQDPERWTAGPYRLLCYEKGKRGIRSAPIVLHIDPGTVPTQKRPDPPPESSATRIRELADLVQTVKSITSDPVGAKLPELMADAFRKGLETVAAHAGNGKTDPFELMSKMRELGLIPKETQKDKSDIRELLVLLKELGIIGASPSRREDNLLDTIRALKELGLIQPPQPAQDDVFAQIEKMKTIMEMLKSIMPGEGGPGEKPSLGVELVRILGPRVPDMVARISNTVDKISEVQKMKLEHSLGVARNVRSQAAPLPAGTPAGEHRVGVSGSGNLPPEPTHTPHSTPLGNVTASASAPTPQAVHSATPAVHPILAEIDRAVATKDTSYYPRLRQLIDIYIGPHIVPSIQSGQITVEMLLTSLAEQLSHPAFASAETAEYFRDFISAQAAPSPTGSVVGRCDTCGMEYEYAAGTVLKDDEACGEGGCAGKVKLVAPEVSAS